MEAEPYKMILTTYEDKLSSQEQYIKRLSNDNLTLLKLNVSSTKNFYRKFN